MSSPIQKITPFFWFDNQAELAAKFYTSIFPNSKIDVVTRYGKTGPGPEGSVMTVGFQLEGQNFVALNGGPVFKFTEAISMVVNCRDQQEIDYYWDKLTSDGGQEVECGWLKDKYGISWQIVPASLPQLLQGDPARATRVMQAIMKMKKLNLAELEQA